jgi:UDP-N-acetylmuramoyl-L-alanyl-D-glutamate--2,6-diaminopimelate ligase
MAMQQLDDVHGAVLWLRDGAVAALRTDSRQVGAGDAFLAWAGARHDGRRHVKDALAAGAVRCLVDPEGVDAFGIDDARVAAVPQLKATAGSIADAWYGQPSRTLEVVAVTGTNGKTSVAWWTAQALSTLGQRCGVIGTLGVGEPPKAGDPAPSLQTTGLTTPDAVLLQATLAAFVRQGLAACTMEASWIGIVDHRLTGTRISVAQFTNFTRDHLDYHGDMAAYWAAKRLLFGWPGLRAAVVNIDDEQGATLADELEVAFAQRGGVAVWTYSTRAPARLQAQNLRHLADGMAFDLVERDTTVPVRCALVGAYNVSNLLAVVGALRALGIGLADAAGVLPQLSPVPGRMQRVGAATAHSPLVVVDYAHTPDALEKMLAAVRPLAGGRVFCVFGCGGDRDRGKRPAMGEIAARLSDIVIVTSDNPRHFPVIEMNLFRAEDLVVLMAFAGDQDQIAGTGRPERYADRGTPVRFHAVTLLGREIPIGGYGISPGKFHLAAFAHAGLDFAKNH